MMLVWLLESFGATIDLKHCLIILRVQYQLSKYGLSVLFCSSNGFHVGGICLVEQKCLFIQPAIEQVDPSLL